MTDIATGFILVGAAARAARTVERKLQHAVECEAPAHVVAELEALADELRDQLDIEIAKLDAMEVGRV